MAFFRWILLILLLLFQFNCDGEPPPRYASRFLWNSSSRRFPFHVKQVDNSCASASIAMYLRVIIYAWDYQSSYPYLDDILDIGTSLGFQPTISINRSQARQVLDYFIEHDEKYGRISRPDSYCPFGMGWNDPYGDAY